MSLEVTLPDVTLDAPALADFVAALAELDDLTRAKTAKVETKGGGSYTYAYSDLADVAGAVRPVLAKHHLAVTQPVESTGTLVIVRTRVWHATRLVWESPGLAMKQPETAQALGSAITYLRRYSLLASLGLATEDDDGKAASSSSSRSSSRTVRRTTPADEAARRRGHAMALFGQLGYGRDDRELRLELTSTIVGHPVESWNSLTPEEELIVIAELQTMVEDRDALTGPEEPYG